MEKCIHRVLKQIAAVWALGALCVPMVAAQNTSLENTDLTRIEDVGSATGNLLSGLFGSTKGLEGSIDLVHVVREVEPELELEITYIGYENGYLRAEAQNGTSSDRKGIPSVRSEPVKLDASGKARVVLSMDSNAEPVSSTFLQLVVAKSASRRTGAYSTWVLPKRWSPALSASNTVVSVHARPITYPPSPLSMPVEAEAATDPTVGAANVESVRLRHPASGKYLVAENGGGGALRLGNEDEYGSTFQLISKRQYGDPTSTSYRAMVLLRTEDGFHFVSIPDKGVTIDARSTDPDLKEVTLDLKYHSANMTGVSIEPKGTYLFRKVGRKKVNNGRGSVGIQQFLAAYNAWGVRARNSQERSFKDKAGAAFDIESSEVEIGGTGASNRRGPADRPIRPGDLVNANGLSDAPELQDILNIFPDVYRDENQASGIYYFLPNAYYLEWKDDAYALSRTYQLAESDDSEGAVSMSVTLQPRVGAAERRVLQVLTQAYAKKHHLPFEAVQAMPVRSGQTTTTLDRILGQYDIPAEDLLVSGPDEALGPITVQWRMGAGMMNNIAEALRSAQGINAGLTLVPEADLDPRRISLHIRLDDVLSFGRIPWDNGQRWMNDRPYPVQLKAGHAIVLDKNDRPTLTTWDMSSTQPIPPGATAVFANDLTTNIIDHAIYRWIEYELVKDEQHTENILRKITGGVSEVEKQDLEVRALNPLETTGAFEIYVTIRSRYLSPSADEVETADVIVEQDRETYTVPFYLGRSQDETPFEYLVSVMMPDGTEHSGKNWLPGKRNLRVAIGPKQIEDSLGFLPTADK